MLWLWLVLLLVVWVVGVLVMLVYSLCGYWYSCVLVCGVVDCIDVIL